jgi:hypothetical protein
MFHNEGEGFMKFHIISLVLLCAISTPLYAMQASVEDAETDEENRKISPTFDTTWLREKTTRRLPETIPDGQKKERIVQEAITRFIDNKNKDIDYKDLTTLLNAVTNPQDTYTSLEKGNPRRSIKNDIDWLIKEAITHIGQQDTNDALALAKRQKIQKWIFLGLTGAGALIAFFEPSLMTAICKGALGD